MATINDVIRGLEILKKYDPNAGESHRMCAEHDVIVVDIGKPVLQPDDEQSLVDLGWIFSSEFSAWSRFV